MWFEELVGFAEESPDQVRRLLRIEGETLHSQVNGGSWRCGALELASLAELRSRVTASGDRSSLSELVANATDLHGDPDQAGAVFQVASQFNLLEMVGPGVEPSEGVGIYSYDPTQGPACAIAAGAGTIYRNYWVPVAGRSGQTEGVQLDALADLREGFAARLDVEPGELWIMQNGYALASESGLRGIAGLLRASSESERDSLRGLLRIGIHRDVQVTSPPAGHLVNQIYGSALPVSYSDLPSEAWEPFARLVLEASYEATFLAAAECAGRTGCRRLHLTLLGGGAFGNELDWILGAIERALDCAGDLGLDMSVVSYGASEPQVQRLLR